MSNHPTFADSIMRSVLASPATLAKLAARGMFASVPLGMPQDLHSINLQILFEGEVTTRSILEVYAPGDETGWAVAYMLDGKGSPTGETELIWGKWELVRGAIEADIEADKESAGEPAQSVSGPGDALGIDMEDEVPQVPTDAETFGDLPREGFGDDVLTETDEVAVGDVASGSWGRTMAEADDTPRAAKRPRSKRRPKKDK